MNKVFVLLLITIGSTVSAQEFIGDWLRQDVNDPFVDEQQVVLVISEDGNRFTGEGPFFGVICKGGVPDVIYFKTAGALANNERRDFDYRVNGGDVITAEGWISDNLISVRSSEDDFPAFKDSVLEDDAEVAFATESAQGERLVNQFKLTGLADALKEIGCQK